MFRIDGDQTNWILVIVLVALALLLALVSTSAYGDVRLGNSQVTARSDQTSQANRPFPVVAQDRNEVRTVSEIWYIGRELYRARQFEQSYRYFETVATRYPADAGAQIWAGMAAFRGGDRAAALRHWNAAWSGDVSVSERSVWPAIALAAAELESGRPDRAARFIVPLERSDQGPEIADHPIVSFYAALVYEHLTKSAPKYREAVEDSLAVKFSPALASSDASQWVSPNSQSWLIFLTKRALQRANRGARSINWTAPVVPESATVEPSLAPTVEELLECLGSADFAAQARRKLRALELYLSPPDRRPEIFDDPETIKRGRFIA
jgi:hypothetical protein